MLIQQTNFRDSKFSKVRVQKITKVCYPIQYENVQSLTMLISPNMLQRAENVDEEQNYQA